MGGAQIYAQAMPLATDLRVYRSGAASGRRCFFPKVDEADWQEVGREACMSSKGTAYAFVQSIRAADIVMLIQT